MGFGAGVSPQKEVTRQYPLADTLARPCEARFAQLSASLSRFLFIFNG